MPFDVGDADPCANGRAPQLFWLTPLIPRCNPTPAAPPPYPSPSPICQDAHLLVDAEQCITLNTAARDYFVMLEVLNRLLPDHSTNDGSPEHEEWIMGRVKSFAKRWKHRVSAGAHIAAPGGQAGGLVGRLIGWLSSCLDG